MYHKDDVLIGDSILRSFTSAMAMHPNKYNWNWLLFGSMTKSDLCSGGEVSSTHFPTRNARDATPMPQDYYGLMN